ncbi:MAG TPA: tRNA pseudouridine(55) synthase TruB [Candidatus Kaiserbacteria bacterium]|nr:tRNA pseudouridine(55) synthase TruB [Candidatus Kaiserbacteria bacterium]
MKDILLIDKPKGITSFDVIRQLRRKLGKKKMGHAGTLDPLASGLMIIGIEGGTKKLNEYIKLSKSYIAEILVGEKRSTGDMEGEIIESAKVDSLSNEEVEGVLKGMVGELMLEVPAFSAIKVGGKRLYKEARKGNKMVLPIRSMKVEKAKLIDIRESDDSMIVEVQFDVESGVYIRSLAEEFGRRVGYPATIKELRRIRIGDFRIEDAESPPS